MVQGLQTGIQPSQHVGIVGVEEYKDWLVKVDLTTDGVQFSTAVETGEMHVADDTSNAVAATDATNQAELNTLLNEIKGDFNTHIAATAYHSVADTANAVTSSNANDLPSSETLNNEIRADYNAHLTQAGVHVNDDGLNIVTSPVQSNLATGQTLANEIKADFNLHLLATVQGTLITAFSKVIDPGIDGEVLWLKANLDMELYADVDNSTGDFKWQGRNKDGTWEDLFSLAEDTDIDIAVQAYVYSGYVQSSVIRKVPFEVRLLIQCDSVGKTVLAKVKNTSYTIAKYLVK